jgi:hypothetical protein
VLWCCAGHSKGKSWLKARTDGQQLLAFVESDRRAGKGITGYEYAVLVTNTDYEVLSLGQLYRDRADAENAFDELKNQWGWGGFTTHDLHRCQTGARAVALAYNWWSLFVRLARPDGRREAITSRPWLMSSVGRRTEHAGQTTITLTGLHAHFEKAQGSADACLCLASRLGSHNYGAVQFGCSLAPDLRAPQTHIDRDCPASNGRISPK